MRRRTGREEPERRRRTQRSECNEEERRRWRMREGVERSALKINLLPKSISLTHPLTYLNIQDMGN